MPTKFMPITMTVITEDGEEKVTLENYSTREDLHKKIGLIAAPPAERRTVFVGTTIASFPHEIIDRDPKRRAVLNELEKIVQENPLKYFLPQATWAVDFLNDTEHNMKCLTAPNGVGKSCVGMIDVLLDICDCDPSWPIFSIHGVKYRRKKGPWSDGGIGVVTYEWDNHKSTIFPLIKRWTPRDALGDFAEGGKRVINWANNPRMDINGTPVWFRACSQAQTVFEGAAMNLYWWDEQGEEAKFDGANARVRRRNGRHIMTLTPHPVEGRPDTGAGSWIHKLYTGEYTAGLNVKFYEGGLDQVPDWVFAEKSKVEVVREWITEPLARGNMKKYREGLSRVYGQFSESTGLVFDEFSRETHVVEPFDIPTDWTRYRAVDHGRIEPCAVLWGAVNPDGDLFLYREMYEKDRLVSENVKQIIEMSGNKVISDGHEIEGRTGRIMHRYTEQFIKEAYRKTVLDSRSFSKKMDGSTQTIGQLYRQEGLKAEPADGGDSYKQIPICKEYFATDPERKHWRTGEMGAPRIYVFSDLKWFLWEIAKYINEAVNRKSRAGEVSKAERPKALDDHLMSALRFMLMTNPVYVHGFTEAHLVDNEKKGVIISRVRDPYTGF